MGYTIQPRHVTIDECQLYMKQKADDLRDVFCSIYTCSALKMDAVNFVLDDLVNDCKLLFREK